MDSLHLINAARLDEALSALKDEVRHNLANVELRVRLFALNSILGRWPNAESDLQAISSLDSQWHLPARLYSSLIRNEAVRREVFAGKGRPSILGEPTSWMAWNLRALELDADGKSNAASELREKAMSEALGNPLEISIDGHDCPWLSDCDSRIGPVLEAYLDGAYYWIPFNRINLIRSSSPEFLVELVWLPAKVTLTTGAELSLQLPVRYPGTEECSDAEIRLGRRTEWRSVSDGVSAPVGQKMFESDGIDFGLLECRNIAFGSSGHQN